MSSSPWGEKQKRRKNVRTQHVVVEQPELLKTNLKDTVEIISTTICYFYEKLPPGIPLKVKLVKKMRLPDFWCRLDWVNLYSTTQFKSAEFSFMQEGFAKWKFFKLDSLSQVFGYAKFKS